MKKGRKVCAKDQRRSLEIERKRKKKRQIGNFGGVIVKGKCVGKME